MKWKTKRESQMTLSVLNQNYLLASPQIACLFSFYTKWVVIRPTSSPESWRTTANSHRVNFATGKQTITASRYSTVYMNFATRVLRSSLLKGLWSVQNVERVCLLVNKGSMVYHLMRSLIKLRTSKIVVSGYNSEEKLSVGKHKTSWPRLHKLIP